MTKKRSSDILDNCLDLVLSGQETVDSALARYPAYADELRPDLETALWLHSRRKAADMRPGYVAAARKRLVHQLKQEAQKPAVAKTPLLAWKPTVFRLALIALFLMVATFTYRGGSQAINASLPGDRLYEVKLAVEDMQLSQASDPVAETELRIALVEKRAQEAENLLEQGRYADAQVAIAGYRKNLSIAADLIGELQDDPQREVAFAQKLAATVTEYNESFSVFVAASVGNDEVPSELVAGLTATMTLNDEITFMMVVLLEAQDEVLLPVHPPAASSTPTPSPTPTATSTLELSEEPAAPSATPEPSATLLPSHTPLPTNSETPEPSDTLEPSATLEPSKTPQPPADNEDDDEPVPTQKPTKTPKPKKPTKTPKDKD